jgi:hypothetical protein
MHAPGSVAVRAFVAFVWLVAKKASLAAPFRRTTLLSNVITIIVFKRLMTCPAARLPTTPPFVPSIVAALPPMILLVARLPRNRLLAIKAIIIIIPMRAWLLWLITQPTRLTFPPSRACQGAAHIIILIMAVPWPASL